LIQNSYLLKGYIAEKLLKNFFYK